LQGGRIDLDQTWPEKPRHQWCLVLTVDRGQFRSNRAVGHPGTASLRGERGCSTLMVWQPSRAVTLPVQAVTASSITRSRHIRDNEVADAKAIAGTQVDIHAVAEHWRG
jgi:hypothetical protein